MEIIKIGNWSITEKGIEWGGMPEVEYLIPKDRISEKGGGSYTMIYDWLFHMTEKAWLTREDIYALNTAFVYALEYFDIGFSDDMSFVETFELQDEQLKLESK